MAEPTSRPHFTLTDCSYYAAALAYTTLLSLVPLLTVSLSIFSAFPMFDAISNNMQTFIYKNFVPASGDVIKNYLDEFVMNTTHLSLIGSIFLVLTALLLLYSIEQTFNKIWQVSVRRSRLVSLLVYWGLLTLTPILVAIGLAASEYFSALPIVSHTTEWLGVTKILTSTTAFLLSAIGFTSLYTVMPNYHVPLRYSILGGAIAALLFEIAKQSFTLYINYFPTYQLLYGTLAVIPIFLIWLYVSWFIILFGAIISYRTMAARQRINTLQN